MSRKFTAFLAALLISSSLVATAVEAGTSATQSSAQTMQAADFKRGKVVKYSSKHPVGSVVVNTKERALYYVLGNGKAVKYKVATPKKGFEWSGSHKVSQKVKWPDWSPPAAMRKRKPELPAYMAGSPDNPLGARAIYLGSSLYRIHGTNEPSSIGKAASSGCIRMLNADVTELYAHVRPGALVVVI
jgi:lipoprotein-anchoring transpeptidase ErfK/SrfK